MASKDVSGDFACGNKTYLNNASVSIMPLQSIEAMRDFMVSYNGTGPDSRDSKPLVEEEMAGARRSVSEIIGCSPDEIVFTQSTTDGVNFVANGLQFPASSSMIIRGGPHEHHANYYPWLRLKNRVEIKDMPVDADGFFDIDGFDSLLDGNARLVALSHALYNTGAILPLERIGRIIDGRASFFVDSAQTVGCLHVDVSEINCDFMAFNGSKWLCGPMGTGLFYCNSKSADLLVPGSVGGESAAADDRGRLTFKGMPERFQTGFRNYVGVVGLGSSARYMLRYGLDNIRSRNRRLSEMLREGISKIDGIILYGPENPDARTSIVSFNVGKMEPDRVVAALEKKGIVLAVREIVDRKVVRASPHFFNTEEEMVAVADELGRL